MYREVCSDIMFIFSCKKTDYFVAFLKMKSNTQAWRIECCGIVISTHASHSAGSLFEI
jgi:hypothetical protein